MALREGHVISGRTLPSTLITLALYGGLDLPRPIKSLQIEDSTITGDIVTPSTQKRPKALLSLRIVNSLVQGAINLKATDFEGDVDMSKTTFEGRVDADNVFFEGKVTIEGSIFRKTAILGPDTDFKQEVSFSRSQFEENIFFPETSFERRVLFTRAIFKSTVDFGASSFLGGLSFFGARFEGDARFDGAHIDFRSFSPIGPFHDAEFLKTASFRRVKISKGSMALVNTSFQGEAYFENLDVAKGRLSFSEVKFRDLANFSGMKVKNLFFGKEPSTFEKAALFRDLYCQEAEFKGTDFHDLADFSGASFHDSLSFEKTRFMGDVDLHDIKLGSDRKKNLPAPFSLKGVRLDKALSLDWDQLLAQPDRRCLFCLPTLKLQVDAPTTWEALAMAFDRAGNLTAKNEALYQREVMKREASDKPEYLSLLQDRFWGYGMRPSRVLLWMVAMVLLFAVIYWTQTVVLMQGRTRWAGIWARCSFAIRFSLRNSWSLDYGRANSATILFKVLTTLQSVGFKLLLLAFVQALANVSPLLNEFVKKLLPM